MEAVKEAAALYERGKDMVSEIPEWIVKEIHNSIVKTYVEICDRHGVYLLDKELNDFDEIRKRFKENNVLCISTLHDDSKLMGNFNIMFRVVHDYFHIMLDCGFEWEGEKKVFEKQAEGLSEDAQMVLYSEIMLQTAFKLWYGYYPEKQKVVLVQPLKNKKMKQKETVKEEKKQEKVVLINGTLIGAGHRSVGFPKKMEGVTLNLKTGKYE